jgi:hypothetical protein
MENSTDNTCGHLPSTSITTITAVFAQNRYSAAISGSYNSFLNIVQKIACRAYSTQWARRQLEQ